MVVLVVMVMVVVVVVVVHGSGNGDGNVAITWVCPSLALASTQIPASMLILRSFASMLILASMLL